MSPSSTLPISEALEYFGVASVPLATLIHAVQEGEDADKNAPEISDLEQEVTDLEAKVKDLGEEIEELENQLVSANEEIAALKIELSTMKAAQ